MISEKKYFAVIGSPVLHSKSPQMMNSVLSGFTKSGEKFNHGHYTRFAVTCAEDALFLFDEIGLKGINITSPLKAQILPFLDEICVPASIIGAVNTVVKEDGKLKGYNTDYIGVVKALQNNDVEIKGLTCLILGAGDAGRAAAYGLKDAGAAKVIIANRTFDRAVKAAKSLDCDAANSSDLEQIITGTDPKIDLIVSALPANVQLIKKEWLNKTIVVFDAVYNQSQLTADANEVGCKVIRGEEWLLNQAVPAYKYFTQSLDDFPRPDERKMTDHLYNRSTETIAKKNVILIGFPGVGKSAVGEYLAKDMGYKYIDTDAMIVSREKMTISDIFKKKSEPYFRFVETLVLKSVAEQYGANDSEEDIILSCGGGIILDRENCNILSKLGTVVWLYSSVETTVGRIHDNSRPILTNMPTKAIQKLFNKRRALYFESSDLVVNSEHSIKDVSDKIKEEVLSIRVD